MWAVGRIEHVPSAQIVKHIEILTLESHKIRLLGFHILCKAMGNESIERCCYLKISSVLIKILQSL